MTMPTDFSWIGYFACVDAGSAEAVAFNGLQRITQFVAGFVGESAEAIHHIGMFCGDVVPFAGVGVQIEERQFELLDAIAVACGDPFNAGLCDGSRRELAPVRGFAAASWFACGRDVRRTA